MKLWELIDDQGQKDLDLSPPFEGTRVVGVCLPEQPLDHLLVLEPRSVPLHGSQRILAADTQSLGTLLAVILEHAIEQLFQTGFTHQS